MSARNNRRAGGGEMKTDSGDLLVGMKAICRYLNGISEATALKYYRELSMPMRKSDVNGTSGQWLASKTKLDEWSRSLAEA